MLSFFVKALLVRTRPPLKSQFSIYAPPHLPYFSPLAHSQNPYTPDLHHSKSLAHSSEKHGGIPPKSEAPAKLLHLFAPFRAYQLVFCLSFFSFTKPQPVRRHHNEILFSAAQRRPLYGDCKMPALSQDEIRKMHAYWRAAKLPDCRPDLPQGQSGCWSWSLTAGRREAKVAGALGHDVRAQLHRYT